MNVGREFGVAVLSMLFMLFVAIDLVLFGVLPLNSVLVTVLPVVGLLSGGALVMARRNRPAAG